MQELMIELDEIKTNDVTDDFLEITGTKTGWSMATECTGSCWC
ncbi:hypothetical protein [Polynucleobacter arcticus]|nr:hypothetical protein [Polynucleobacter arcticus]